MRPSEATGERLAGLVRATLAPGASREPLHRALLVEPLCLAHLGPKAPAGPALKLRDGQAVRLLPSPALKVPVAPLYVSGAAMAAAAADQELWADGVPRGVVLERGAAFALLRGSPGALVVVDADLSLPLDAGEVAALADGKTAAEYATELRAMVAGKRGREAARRLVTRPLYVLGHPRGGLLLLGGDLPAFLHLPSAEAFADRIAKKTGDRPEHGLVAAADLFQKAHRGKLRVLIDPGPESFALTWVDLR